MKIIAYSTRPDEQYGFDKFSKELQCNIKYVKEPLSLESASDAEGFECVSILGHGDASRKVLTKLKELGVKYLSTRAAGYNNIDVKAAKELGIKISNATYSPNCVADFATMLILMSIRKVNTALQRGAAQDFSLPSIQGREMKNLVIGVIGTGRIGQTLIKNISGFGCKIIGYDLYPNEEMKKYIEYVDLDTLYSQADVITLHTPLFDSNYHLINKDAIDKMKNNVVIVNTARGELIDTSSLIEGLENGKIAAAGLDVLENEVGTYHNDKRFEILKNHNMSILRQLPNVILTHHFAFYTDQAVCDMVECSLRSLHAFKHNLTNHWEIKAS